MVNLAEIRFEKIRTCARKPPSLEMGAAWCWMIARALNRRVAGQELWMHRLFRRGRGIAAQYYHTGHHHRCLHPYARSHRSHHPFPALPARPFRHFEVAVVEARCARETRKSLRGLLRDVVIRAAETLTKTTMMMMMMRRSLRQRDSPSLPPNGPSNPSTLSPDSSPGNPA